MNGGGHLEFSDEKVDEQNGNSFVQSFRVNISEKSQLLKSIESQNDKLTYTTYSIADKGS